MAISAGRERRLIDESARSWPSAALALRIRPTALAVAHEALIQLARTLEDPRASWLLSDGSGPLYTTTGVQLVREIETAVDALWGEA